MRIKIYEKSRVFITDFIKLLSLRKFVNRNSLDGIFYICDLHLGDTAIACSYASSFKKITKNNIFMVINEEHREIPKLFDLECIIFKVPYFTDSLTEAMKQIFLNLTNLFSHKKIFLSFPGFLQYFKIKKKSVWLDMYLRYMLTFDVKYPLKLESIKRTHLNGKYYLDKSFKELKLVKGKTVVISPNSRTMKSIDPSFFADIYRELSSQGFTPIINSKDNYWNEMNIKNFFPEPQLLIDYISLGGYSISSRSGISDLVSFLPDSKNLVIYNEDVNKDFIFADKKLELYGEIKEFFYNKYKKKELVEEIVKYIRDLNKIL